LRFLHLSDLHIGKSNNIEKTARIVDWIILNKGTHQSRIVVISGDLVDDGHTWQFSLAREQLDRLREENFTVLVVPGNHDYGPDGIRERTSSQEDFIKMISGITEYPYAYLEMGQAFILLDSMAEEIKTREFWGAQGNLGAGQLLKLDQLLDELAHNPAVENIVLVLHHHPFDYRFYHGLRDQADLKAVIARRIEEPPRVNVLLFGHKHNEHRFNDPDENKEELFGINIIYASGQTVERDQLGRMVIPVIDLEQKAILRFFIQ